MQLLIEHNDYIKNGYVQVSERDGVILELTSNDIVCIVRTLKENVHTAFSKVEISHFCPDKTL